MGVALGLGAALAWGLADYGAALASRHTGALRVVLGFHLVATAVMVVAVVATDALSGVTAADLPVFVLIGAVGWLSYLTFYRALAIGPISIVSPIVSGYAAVTVVFAVIILDERLSAGQIAAVAIVLAGVVLASSNLRQLRSVERVAALALGLAILAMIGLGAFVFGVAYQSEEFGWLAPVFLARGFTTVFLLGHVAVEGDWRFPDRSPRLVGTIALLAVLDTSGYFSFNFGVRHADTSLVATAAAPYSLVPIVAGVLLLAERPGRLQWAGVALVIAGVLLLGIVA